MVPFPGTGDGPAHPGHGTVGQGAGWMDRCPWDAFMGFLLPWGRRRLQWVVRGGGEDLPHRKKIWKNPKQSPKTNPPAAQMPPCKAPGFGSDHQGLVQTIKVWFKSRGLVGRTKLLCFPSLVSALKTDLF